MKAVHYYLNSNADPSAGPYFRIDTLSRGASRFSLKEGKMYKESASNGKERSDA